MSRLAIIGATVLDTAAPCPAPLPRTILVKDGHIADLVEPTLIVDAEILDATNLYAIPGMIDARFHPFYNEAAPSVPAHLRSIAHNVRLALRRLPAWLESGVTTVRSPGIYDNLDLELREVICAGDIQAPRLYAAGMPIVPFTDGQWTQRGLATEIMGPDEARRAARYQIKAGADLLQIYADSFWGDGRQPCMSGHPSLTEQELRAVVEEAEHAGVPCCAHAVSPEAVKNCLRAGVQSMDGATSLDDEILELLHKRQVPIIWTPSSPCADSAPDTEHLPARVDLSNLRKAKQAGVHVAIGSSADIACHPLAEGCHLLVTAGFTPYEALQSATWYGAESLHRQAELGSLTRGRAADIVFLQANPLADIRNLTRVCGVLKAGQLLLWQKEEEKRG